MGKLRRKSYRRDLQLLTRRNAGSGDVCFAAALGLASSYMRSFCRINIFSAMGTLLRNRDHDQSTRNRPRSPSSNPWHASSIRRIASHRSARNVANRSPFVCPLNLIHNHYTHYTQSTIRAGSRDSRAASLPWATADRHPDPTHPWRERSDLLSAHYIVQWWTEDPNLSRGCSPII